MDRISGRVYLVTGASSGIGRDIAFALAEKGATVYGAARRDFDGEGKVIPVTMDVGDDESVAAAFREIGTVYGLINCAGCGIAGAVEDCTPAEAAEQLNVNTLGALRTARAALPYMREAGDGVIINIGSIGGDFPLPYQGLYSMSKAALRKMTECLRMEVSRFGIQAAIIEPGDLKTGFTGARRQSAETAGSVYEAKCLAAVAQMAKDEQNGRNPSCVTNALMKMLSRRHIPACRAVGGFYAVLPFIARFLPYPAIEMIIKIMYKA